MTANDVFARGNRLLAALDPGERDHLAPHVAEVELSRGQVLFEADQELTEVYFPHNCVVSLVAVMSEGATAETATIGREGAVGFVTALGGHRAVSRSVVQVPGRAASVPFAQMQKLFAERAEFRQLMLCYTEALLAQVLQSVACNALHDVEARFCRWILMAQDRVDGDELPLTHEFIAEMLGVQRSSVTLAARRLQAAGLIRYRRGQVTVVNRAGLEDASCECYAAVRRQFDRLLPHTFRAPEGEDAEE